MYILKWINYSNFNLIYIEFDMDTLILTKFAYILKQCIPKFQMTLVVVLYEQENCR